MGGVSTALIIPFLKIHQRGQDTKVSIGAKLKRLDLLGMLVIIPAVCCLILALQWGQASGRWSQPRVVGYFVSAFVLTVTFGVIQWTKGDAATIPLRVLRQRSTMMGAWYLFFLEMAIYVVSQPLTGFLRVN